MLGAVRARHRARIVQIDARSQRVTLDLIGPARLSIPMVATFGVMLVLGFALYVPLFSPRPPRRTAWRCLNPASSPGRRHDVASRRCPMTIPPDPEGLLAAPFQPAPATCAAGVPTNEIWPRTPPNLVRLSRHSNIRVRSGAATAVQAGNLVRSFSICKSGFPVALGRARQEWEPVPDRLWRARWRLPYRTTVRYSSRIAAHSEGTRGQPARAWWTTRRRVLASGGGWWTGGRARWVDRGWGRKADPQHVAIGGPCKPLHLVV